MGVADLVAGSVAGVAAATPGTPLVAPLSVAEIY